MHSTFPNTFNLHVKTIFSLTDVSQINLSIVNILDEIVRTFKIQCYTRVLNIIVCNGGNDFGHDLNTEIYFCRLKSENIHNSIKLLNVK